jgi:hypothetical protein
MIGKKLAVVAKADKGLLGRKIPPRRKAVRKGTKKGIYQKNAYQQQYRRQKKIKVFFTSQYHKHPLEPADHTIRRPRLKAH